VGEEVFRDVFGIRTREDIVKTSLTFVIDVTGSMGDDIKAVVRATKKIVNEAKDSQFVPENYILVTFSDPGLFSPFSKIPTKKSKQLILSEDIDSLESSMSETNSTF
jgi:hypothetical protein